MSTQKPGVVCCEAAVISLVFVIFAAIPLPFVSYSSVWYTSTTCRVVDYHIIPCPLESRRICTVGKIVADFNYYDGTTETIRVGGPVEIAKWNVTFVDLTYHEARHRLVGQNPIGTNFSCCISVDGETAVFDSCFKQDENVICFIVLATASAMVAICCIFACLDYTGDACCPRHPKPMNKTPDTTTAEDPMPKLELSQRKAINLSLKGPRVLGNHKADYEPVIESRMFEVSIKPHIDDNITDQTTTQ